MGGERDKGPNKELDTQFSRSVYKLTVTTTPPTRVSKYHTLTQTPGADVTREVLSFCKSAIADTVKTPCLHMIDPGFTPLVMCVLSRPKSNCSLMYDTPERIE